jgi:hypothetical protein
MRESLRNIEFEAKYKLRRDRDFMEFKGRMRLTEASQKTKFRRKDAKLFGQELLRNSTDGRNSQRENHRFVHGPLDPVDQWRS